MNVFRFVAFCYVTLILSGCANQSLLTDFTPGDLSPYTNLSEVPFFPQEPLLCGPAALATVINYYDQQTLPETLTDKLWTPEAKGTFGIDMIAATRSEDMLAIKAPDDLEELLLLTSDGWPSIHLLNLGFKHLPQWHYAVLVGYDLQNNEVLLRSGKVHERKMSFKHFKRSKTLADNWGIVPVTLDKLPTLHSWEPVFKELLNLTQVKPELKLEAFASSVLSYPDQWQFLFANANNLFELKQFDEATNNYTSALELAADNASIWNNLSYSLVEQGCVDIAKESIQCAAELSPNDSNISQSVSEILSVSSTHSNLQCPLEISCPKKY